MSTTAQLPAESGTGDRLALTLFIAVVIHAVIILGIGFNPLDRFEEDLTTPTIDITIVNSEPMQTPEEYDYLAEVSQDGAGNTMEKVPLQQESAAQTAPMLPSESKQATTRLITSDQSDTLSPEQTESPSESQQEELSATELINRSMEMMALNEQINQSMQAYSEAPRQKYISARTREFKYATYMRDWVTKVERLGELNYPDEARRRHLSGSLIVDVAIYPDGSVKDISVVRPSGHKILDDAAVRIVRLAAPFAPFYSDIRQETDVLHITRTWEFTSNNRLQGR